MKTKRSIKRSMLLRTTRVAFLLTAMVRPLCGDAAQHEPLSPEESRSRMMIAPDVRIELIAAEPQVFDPVALCFDAVGNLYVVEDRGYPSGDPEGPVGSVALLRDEDGDGYYETRHTFAKGFDFPNGVMPWKGGILVTAAPHVYYMEDTDGDHAADVREIFLEGFKRGGSTQLYVSHPTLGLDNGLHFTNGLSGGAVRVPGHPEIDELDIGRYDLRYDPRTHALETRAGRAQFGLSFDDFGHKYTCSNRNHLVHSVLEPSDLARNPYLNQSEVVQDIPVHGAASSVFALSSATTTAYAHEGTFTAACGLVVYRGTALPEKYYGNTFVCEPTGNLVHRDVLSVKGGTFDAVRAPEESESEFLATTDEWTRPVFLTNGPDGALYLCDMYRKTIEHPTYLPDEVAAVTDFDAGKGHGRIYRITGSAEYTPQPFMAKSHEDRVKTLGHPNGWHRDTAQRLLLEQLDDVDPALLRESVHNGASPQAKALSLHLLAAINGLSATDLVEALGDESAAIREQALRLSRELSMMNAELQEAILDCSDDPAENVRFACALVLGDGRLPMREKHAALASILMEDFEDPWLRTTVLSALGEGSADFSRQLLQYNQDSLPAQSEFFEALARIIAQTESSDDLAQFASQVLGHELKEGFSWQLAAFKGMLDGIRLNRDYASSTTTSDTLRTILEADHPAQATEVGEWMGRCETLARDGDVVAIGILSHADVEGASSILIELLSPNTTQTTQSAAVTVLNTFRDDRVARAYLQPNVWLGFAGETRKTALNGILSAPDGLETLIAALENGDIGAWSMDASSRARVSRTGTPEQRERAATVFNALQESDPAERYEEYRDVLELMPHPQNGRRVFQEVCMGCHRYEDIGHEVGPDLTGIRSQPLESILMHIINPNWLMLPGYESYTVETKDGNVYTGLIASETSASITLKQGLGIETTILRGEITVLETNSLSMMPEELEAGMSRQELRDLLGFLKAE